MKLLLPAAAYLLGSTLAVSAQTTRPAAADSMPDLPAGAEVVELDEPTDFEQPPLVENPTMRQTDERLDAEVTVRVQLDYVLALPEGYADDPGRRWPVLVFLHGSGERGDDLRQVKAWGPPRMAAEGRSIPAIVVSPQCPADSSWGRQVAALSALLDRVEAEHRVDPNRIYLTGLSMGGYGIFEWAAQEPDRFAALVPICGGASGTQAWTLAGTPTWIFHGTADEAVPVGESIRLYETMREAGAGDAVKLTLYDGIGHNSWEPAYADDRLWQWLLEQEREPNDKSTTAHED